MNSATSLRLLILAGARRLFSLVWHPRTEPRRRRESWETNFVCSEAPLCAELLRRSHHNGR